MLYYTILYYTIPLLDILYYNRIATCAPLRQPPIRHPVCVRNGVRGRITQICVVFLLLFLFVVIIIIIMFISSSSSTTTTTTTINITINITITIIMDIIQIS